MAVTKKLLGAAGAVALSLGALAPAAHAEDKLNYAITLTGVSDYMFRGISLTEEEPAFQPYIEFTYNIFYLAFWGSNIDTGPEGLGPWELDIYTGIRPTTGPVTWDIAALWYMYDGKAPNTGIGDVSYLEFKVAATITPVQNLTTTLTGYVTPDQGSATPVTETIEGTVAYTLPQLGIFVPTLSGQYGYTNAETDGWFLGETDYTYWNAGVKLTVDKFFMDFRYWDTSINDGLADERFLFSAGVNLP